MCIFNFFLLQGSSSANRLWNYTAKSLLSWNCMSYCLNVLKGLLKDKNKFKVEEVRNNGSYY